MVLGADETMQRDLVRAPGMVTAEELTDYQPIGQLPSRRGQLLVVDDARRAPRVRSEQRHQLRLAEVARLARESAPELVPMDVGRPVFLLGSAGVNTSATRVEFVVLGRDEPFARRAR
jgi:hypothetical protein